MSRSNFSANETAILLAPLRLSQARWTSQDVADATGTSQSAVARTWKKYFSSPLQLTELPRSVEIVGFHHAQGNSFIGLRSREPLTLRNEDIADAVMRSPRRIPLQTMLAAQIFGVQKSKPTAQSPEDPFHLTGTSYDYILGTSLSLDKLAQSTTYIRINSDQWQHLLHYLIQEAHLTQASSLRELQQELVAWAGSATSTFTWITSPALVTQSTPSHASSNKLRSTQQVIADDIFNTIVDLIWQGRLTAGDRITESSLARKLHTTRNQTRDALRTLASSGLVDHHPVRGVLVPSPKQSDIADIYAARRALGTEIVRRIVENPNSNLREIEKALAELIKVGKTGNSYETGNSDLHFQDVMATASGMRNIPQIFEVLAKQLRIYIAVMGMTYVYSIENMLANDTEIYQSLKNKDLAGAVEVWNRKIDDAVEFMLGHVNRIT